MASGHVSRRRFLGATITAAGGAAFPRVLGAQPKAVKIGVISPVTGPMAEVG